jgi:hypothetical protein
MVGAPPLRGRPTFLLRAFAKPQALRFESCRTLAAEGKGPTPGKQKTALTYATKCVYDCRAWQENFNEEESQDDA